MTDLVFRLKQMEEFFHLDYHRIKKIGREAANRIENLEAALREIDIACDYSGAEYVCRGIARKALEGKDGSQTDL